MDLYPDVLVIPGPDNKLLTSVYGKPTCTDQYLPWDSHHKLSAKYSEYITCQHRASTVCANSHLLQEEEEHISQLGQ